MMGQVFLAFGISFVVLSAIMSMLRTDRLKKSNEQYKACINNIIQVLRSRDQQNTTPEMKKSADYLFEEIITNVPKEDIRDFKYEFYVDR